VVRGELGEVISIDFQVKPLVRSDFCSVHVSISSISCLLTSTILTGIYL
jgi:hypothetical protein